MKIKVLFILMSCLLIFSCQKEENAAELTTVKCYFRVKASKEIEKFNLEFFKVGANFLSKNGDLFSSIALNEQNNFSIAQGETNYTHIGTLTFDAIEMTSVFIDLWSSKVILKDGSQKFLSFRNGRFSSKINAIIEKETNKAIYIELDYDNSQNEMSNTFGQFVPKISIAYD